MVKSHVKRAALLLLLCAALLTTAFAYAPSQRSDISIRLTPPGGEAVQRAEVEIEFTDNTGSGLQTAHVKVGGASWREITSQLDRTDNRYRYVAEVTENGTVTARVIGLDGTVFEKSAEIDCFRAASGGTQDRTEEDVSAAVGKEDRTPSPLTPEGQGTVLDNAGEEDGKEFFTFKTPSEHVFYLVIDRQRNGENVYFLNAVTESDLMELAEKDREDEKNGAGSVTGGMPVSAVPEPEPVCVCKDKCVPGDVKAGCPVCVLSWKDCEGEAPAPDGTEPEKTGGNGAGMIFVLLVALAAGGAGWYLKIYKPRHDLAGAEDFDELTGGEEESVHEEDEDEDGADAEPGADAGGFRGEEGEYEPGPADDSEPAEPEPEDEGERDFFDLA